MTNERKKKSTKKKSTSKKSKKCDIERIGIFLGPKGFMDFKRDTVVDCALEQSRALAAQKCFQESDLPEIGRAHV